MIVERTNNDQIVITLSSSVDKFGLQQVIDYMKANSATSDTEAVAETERYIAIAGQALAYKIGELKIKELRARAEAELGDKFDIRGFHAEVLQDGSVPLAVLEAKIDRWIAAQK